MKSERQHREEIVRIGGMIHQRGYIAATDGNISVRLSKDRIMVTPTAMCKGMLGRSDLVIVDLEGQKLSGRREVTSEVAMHLLIYNLRPDVRAVVHAHPPTATGYAAAGVPLKSVTNHWTIPATITTIPQSRSQMMCGSASRIRKKTVSRDRRRS